MDTAGILLGCSNVFCAIVFILLSIPLAKGSISMNKHYGFRFAKAYESEENWYRINRYGGKQLIIWSVVLAILGVVTCFFPLEGKAPWIVVIALAPLIVIIPAVVTSYLYARKQ